MKRKTDPNPITWPRRPHRWLWDSAEWEYSSTWEKLILIEPTLKHWICCLGLASQLNSNIQSGMGVQHSPVGVWWFGCVVGGRATYLVLTTRHNLSRDTAKYIHDYWICWYGVCGVVVLLLFIFRILSREYPKKPHSSISYTFRFSCVRIENFLVLRTYTSPTFPACRFSWPLLSAATTVLSPQHSHLDVELPYVVLPHLTAPWMWLQSKKQL